MSEQTNPQTDPAQPPAEGESSVAAPPDTTATVPEVPAVPEPSLLEKIQAELAKGTGLDQLATLQALLTTELNQRRAEEREKAETARRAKRAELVGQITSVVDLGSLLSPFLAAAKECGLLGLDISFSGDTLGITPRAQALAVPKAAAASADGKPKAEAAGVKAPAGQSAQPGDEQTWMSVTSEADRDADKAAIEAEVVAAEARGRTGPSVRNSITWRVRHDRIQYARTGSRVGHLK
jgi:hypothetical protein